MIACGIDSGARATKVVLLREGGGLLSYADVPTGATASGSAEEAVRQALGNAGAASDDISFTTVTGYGRATIEADRRLTEITCHARGARAYLPGVRTVLDVGGQDSKVISLDDAGNIVDFAMNDRCAAGTGRFLEVIAGILGVETADLSDLALGSSRPAPIASVCVVFTESEVVSLIAKQTPPADIAAGVLESMATRMRGVMGHIPPRGPAVFAGGVARSAAFAEALAGHIGIDLAVPERPHLNGALGAALFSLDKIKESAIQGT